MKYQDYLDGTAKVLKDSQKQKFPYKIEVLGKRFLVHRGVFSPKHFGDTVFAELLPILQGQSLLEIGTGTGVVAITAFCKGAHPVLAVDINPHAIRNAKENLKLHGFYHLDHWIKVRKSNLFETVGSKTKFDVIFWNVPFGFVEKSRCLSTLERAVFDPGYKNIGRFLKQAPRHLNPDGRILIGFSSTLGKIKLLKRLSQKAGLDLKQLWKIKSQEVHPITLELWEAKNNHQPRR